MTENLRTLGATLRDRHETCHDCIPARLERRGLQTEVAAGTLAVNDAIDLYDAYVNRCATELGRPERLVVNECGTANIGRFAGTPVQIVTPSPPNEVAPA